MIVNPCHDRPVLAPCTLPDRQYQVDPYIGCEHYCYYCYVLEQAETDWREEVLFHADIADRLASALSGIPPQTIYMGWHTDPYQPCEKVHRQTRQVLEVLLQKGFSASILTKSDLVLRDADLLQRMDNATVSVSVAFNDNATRRLFEANTMDTEKRVAALEALKAKGIRTSTLICPVIPYITDAVAMIHMLAPHVDKIWIYGLSVLNPSDQNWQNVETILGNHFSGLKDQIKAAVFAKDHPFWEDLRQELVPTQKDRGLDLSIHI